MLQWELSCDAQLRAILARGAERAHIILILSLSSSCSLQLMFCYVKVVTVCTDTPCLLKTGMNAGPNYLKSFYICPQKCGFVKKTRHA